MKRLCLILMVLISLTTFGQERACVWYFGQNGAGLDFKCEEPVAIRSGMYYATEGCASISDTLGNILFYTNGDTVYNRDHSIMPNGFGLGQSPDCWGSSTQGALIIPVPESNSLYYIFTTDCADSGTPLENGLRYSIVDMTLNDGMGDVTTKFQHLTTPVTEKLAAVHHGNGTDIWVLAHGFGTNDFYAYLIDATGIDTIPVISSEGQIHWLPGFSESMARGYMKFSPDGKRIVVLSISDNHSYSLYPELFHFNDTTGLVSLDYTVEDPDSINYYGASFSPDNNLLYLSGGWKGNYVHQFDATTVSSPSFLESREVIHTTSGGGYVPSALQIGPDGKIYVATHASWIDVIKNPNLSGEDCNYHSEEIYLHDCPIGTKSLYGLPNFPESYFRSTVSGEACSDTIAANFSYENTCEGLPTQFFDSTLIFPEIVNYWEWDFGDPLSGVDNYSDVQNPAHTYSTPGTYNVTLIVHTDLGTICKSDTIVLPVNISVCTDIQENSTRQPSVKVFPNPFKGSTCIELTNIENAEIDIFSIAGEHIEHIDRVEQTNLKFELGQNVNPGVYLLTIRTSNAFLTQQILKIE